jgi:hypothetical protein
VKTLYRNELDPAINARSPCRFRSIHFAILYSLRRSGSTERIKPRA